MDVGREVNDITGRLEGDGVAARSCRLPKRVEKRAREVLPGLLRIGGARQQRVDRLDKVLCPVAFDPAAEPRAGARCEAGSGHSPHTAEHHDDVALPAVWHQEVELTAEGEDWASCSS